MHPIIKEIKRRLRKAGFSYLRVYRGRGTAYCWLEVRRPDYDLLSIEEEKAIHKAFNKKYEGARGKTFSILITVAEMQLGLIPK